MLSTGLQRHQSELVNGLSPLNPNYTEWLQQAGGAFGGTGDSITPLAVLYSQVQRQAAMLAFLDVFHSLMIVVLCVAPVVFFMRSGKSGGGGMAH
jgi:DHA2 family multidrug resistance protein